MLVIEYYIKYNLIDRKSVFKWLTSVFSKFNQMPICQLNTWEAFKIENVNQYIQNASIVVPQ